MTSTLTRALTGPVASVAYPAPCRYVFTAARVTADPIVLTGMGEMAVALHFSGHALPRELSVADLADLVVRGVLAAGGVDRVQDVAEAARAVNCDGLARRITATQWRRRTSQVWSSRSREYRCLLLAYRILLRADRDEVAW